MFKKCEHCGNEFEVRRKDTKWCSALCAGRNFRSLNGDRRRQQKREWDEQNKDHKKNYERNALKDKEQLRNYRKNYSLKRYFGISLDQYNELLEKQGYRCAICDAEEPKSGRKFAVDHAHKASPYIPEGAVRGLLCWQCNTKVIGKFTNPDTFQRAADYLRQHTGFIVPEEYTKGRKKKRRKRPVKVKT